SGQRRGHSSARPHSSVFLQRCELSPRLSSGQKRSRAGQDAWTLTPGQWENAYPTCDRTCVADTNGDQLVNGFNIDGFIHALNTGTRPRDIFP
ncbi:MAG: hypothetical protein KKB50_15145, partial [Planctomycetes bacterium]|nr:hypothetical protein [Planctomycetota bacterium]